VAKRARKKPAPRRRSVGARAAGREPVISLLRLTSAYLAWLRYFGEKFPPMLQISVPGGDDGEAPPFPGGCLSAESPYHVRDLVRVVTDAEDHVNLAIVTLVGPPPRAR
jgi:hypothetical protein